MSSTLTRSRILPILLTVGCALISVAILFILIYRERAVLFTYDWQLRWHFALAGFILLSIGMIMAAAVWADLMRALGSQIAFTTHIRFYVLSQLAKRLPGTVWYIAGRSYLYKQQGESVRLVTVASSLELAITVLSGCLTTLAFAAYSLIHLSGFNWVGIGVALMIGLVAVHPTVMHRLLRRIGRVETADYQFRHVLRWLFIYTIIWILGGIIFYVNANAVANVDLQFLPQIIGFWCMVGTLSVLVFFLPSNLGFTEVGLSLLLSTLLPSSLAVLIAVLSRILILLYEIGGVLLILLCLRMF